jgi:hypothetical protein
MLRNSLSGSVSYRPVRHVLRKAGVSFAAAACVISLAAAARPGVTGSSAVPPDQAPRSAIALAFDSTGSGFAFYRGQDNGIYMRTFRGRQWSGQHRIGGRIIGAPAAAVARTTVVVAGRGTDNTLKLRMMHNGTWGRWTSWGGALTSAPAITGGDNGRIDVFVRGADHALWSRTLRPGQPLGRWKRLGGHLSSGPAAVSVGNGVVEVAAAGADHAVWTTSTTARWAWKSIGGHTRSAPAIGYIPQTNGAWVLIRGYRDGLWAEGLGGGGVVTAWRRIGSKQIVGAPTAAGTREPVGYEIAAVRGIHGTPWITRYPTAAGGWSAYFRAWKPEG